LYKNALRPAWVEIDLDALEFNINSIKEKVGPQTELIGVVKANAYGHGSVECAKVLRANGVSHFAVATVEEGIELRHNGIEDSILILGVVPGEYARELIHYHMTPVATDYDNMKMISDLAAEKETTVPVMIAVDTGMGRIGYQIGSADEQDAAAEEIRAIDELPGIEIRGMISHFSTSDEADRSYTKQQLRLFNDFYEKLSAEGIALSTRTIANSAAIMEYNSALFDAARPGIILYGCYPSDEVDQSHLALKPVMSVKANIVHLKTLPAGKSISYGRKFTTERESRIATIGIGYADGYSRALSGNVEVLVHGKRVPVVGNICMDQCMIDVTDVPDVSKNDEVVIMGASGDERITAEELAGKLGTINYEVLCNFDKRLPKVFLRDGEEV